MQYCGGWNRYFTFSRNFSNEGDIGQCRLRGKNEIKIEGDVVLHRRGNGFGAEKHPRLRDRCIDKINETNWRNIFDENVVIPLCQKFLRENNPHSFPQFKWQKSFHDHVIRNQKDLENHFNYTVNNFRKHDLPENWKWNSGNFEEMIDGVI